MMASGVKNIVASVRAKLANIAKVQQRSFDSILLLYMQERLLYRLSVSNYVDSFVLKGGLLMFILTDYKGRPTKDIDFLAYQISNDFNNLKSVFQEICNLVCVDDGLLFDPESVYVEKIKEGADYEGARIKLVCNLGNAKKLLQLDIGFGDIVVPKPEFMSCPTLLDIVGPMVKVYSVESIIAEKFHAMLVLAELNSRMKDFYDVFVLLSTNSFGGESLQTAIAETIKCRHADIKAETVIFTRNFSTDANRNAMWQAFIRKIGVKEIQFAGVMEAICLFLKPIYDAILKNEVFLKKWDNVNKIWS